MKDFVHLHNHSDFSLLRATSTVSGLVTRARNMNMPGIALTDDGNLFGAYRFYQECRNEPGINPIIGCDFFMASDSRHSKSASENSKHYQRIVLLAKNDRGYRNLIKLSSMGYTEGFYYKPRIDKELLEAHHEDLIALSGGLGGEIPQLISRNRVDEAREAAAWYADLFGKDHFYLELTDHGIADQQTVNRSLIEFSRDMNLPLVATNDSYYLEPEDAHAHDVMLCIGNKRKINEPGRFKFSSDQFYLKSPEEMWRIFGEHPQALTNTMKINEMIDIQMELPGPLLPDYDIPQEFEGPDNYLRHLSNEGLKNRYEEITDEMRKRLDYELDIIISMGFTGYFLIVWDFIRYAKDHDIPVGPGRGSGAGSIIAYCLEITDIDPLKYGLLFERFLNPERVSMPDFDIDFCFERRQEVIDYVTRKYGTEKVGQIITFGTLKPKAVIRDVARVLDFSYDEADRIAKLIPDGPKITIEKALEEEPKLQELYDSGGGYRELIDVSKRLQKLNRHASTHAAGIVIGKDELTEYVPLFRDPKTGAISTQYTMDQLEDNGLVKMDFLGLKTLTLIRNTEKLIAQTGVEVDTATIPEDDEATYKLLGEGLSSAVFQFESEGMQNILKEAKPNCIEDLIALNALYRPGPMDNIPQFIESKWGRTAIIYPHENLEAVLKETYGVIVYQEQVMETVRIIGGFSLGKADILRRAMGKKKEKDMARMRVEYMEGAKEKGIDEQTADGIFELLKPFAGYGFNKSHAAAYSVLAYKTAYLKANYPAQFMAANLTNEIDHPDKFADYLGEARIMGIDILPPDVNDSDKYFTVVDGNIVFGLMGIKGVGSSAVDEILREREENGSFTSMDNFLERVDLKTVNRRVIETMVQCGVFDRVFPSRKGILEKIEELLEIAVSKKDGKRFGQTGLFDDSPAEAYPELVLDDSMEYDLADRLGWERELIGYYFSGHPMDSYKNEWVQSSTLDLAQLTRARAGEIYAVVGLITQYRAVMTKRGNRMSFGTLEDYRGEIDFVLFPETFASFSEMVQPDAVLGMMGEVDLSRDKPQMVVKEIRLPADMDRKDNGSIHIKLKTVPEQENDLLSLRELINDSPGNCPVLIHVPAGDGERIIRATSHLQISSPGAAALETHPLVERVWKEYLETTIEDLHEASGTGQALPEAHPETEEGADHESLSRV
ncbi:DNA polymerase III subunit alpha [Salinispira pacifica]|uniref:DNA polymerase III subunit alpha n=1 Tax=Salinispira pacifica TaxID=1307761 RepID=V5WF89_9SPIO|nr:DNA polymerase III subunit alpha [Salinispira pacifica]AHC14462.1 DNA polymerase III alpha subunit [Salinispira pacifica]